MPPRGDELAGVSAFPVAAVNLILAQSAVVRKLL